MPGRTSGGRDELTRSLRELRQAAGLSGKQTSAAAGIQASKLSRIERGRTVPSESDVQLLARIYRVTPDQHQRLLEMVRDVRAENRRVVFNRDPGGFQDRIGRIEEASTLARSFSPNIIPGLLQSAAYARALMRWAGWSPDITEQAVASRLNRQRRLDDEQSPRRFVIITTEGGLGWAAGPPGMMIEQLERIAAATYRPNARVGIVPFGRPAEVFPLHSWDLFDQRAAIVGTTTATAILTEPRDVAAYVELTDALQRLAVYGAEAREILNRVVDRYQKLDQ
ncbi:MAG: helix-turn-helix domain-containing protein [Pseudonocardiaceae bacterium]